MIRNYAQLYAICKALSLEKEDVVLDFTEGKTSSLSALSDGDYHELMIRLRKLQPAKSKVDFTPKPGDAQRKKLIALAGKMHWGSNTIEIVGRLNNWSLENYGVELNQLDVNTLNKVLWVMENKIYKDYLNKV